MLKVAFRDDPISEVRIPGSALPEVVVNGIGLLWNGPPRCSLARTRRLNSVPFETLCRDIVLSIGIMQCYHFVGDVVLFSVSSGDVSSWIYQEGQVPGFMLVHQRMLEGLAMLESRIGRPKNAILVPDSWFDMTPPERRQGVREEATWKSNGKISRERIVRIVQQLHLYTSTITVFDLNRNSNC
ncbi:uncharacterized protein LOC143921612 [Arctopsyche grandis]|uniref:uncharacterized protein LOC143921612 n=1 Tax=Arctopsyche grandis TaxID=121162 RepID=UPI00406D87A8